MTWSRPVSEMFQHWSNWHPFQWKVKTDWMWRGGYPQYQTDHMKNNYLFLSHLQVYLVALLCIWPALGNKKMQPFVTPCTLTKYLWNIRNGLVQMTIFPFCDWTSFIIHVIASYMDCVTHKWICVSVINAFLFFVPIGWALYLV